MKNFTIAVLLFVIGAANVASAAQVDWDVRAETGFKYDDNIRESDTNEEDDVINQTLLGIGLSQEAKTFTLEGEVVIRQQFYFDESSLNNNAQDFNLDLKKELSEYQRVNLSNVFTHGEEATNFDDILGGTPGHYEYIRNRFGAGYEKDISEKLSFEGNYGNEVYAPDRDGLRDSFLNRVGGQLNYMRSSALSFLAAYDFVNRDYSPGESIQLHIPKVGARYYLTPKVSTDAQFGVSFSEVENGDNSSNPFVLLGITNEFSEVEKLSLTFQQQSTANESTQDVFTSWRLTASFIKLLTERTKSTVSLFYGQGDFESSNTEQELTGVRGRLDYELTRHARIFGAYEFTDKQSNIADLGYKKNVVSLGCSLEF